MKVEDFLNEGYKSVTSFADIPEDLREYVHDEIHFWVSDYLESKFNPETNLIINESGNISVLVHFKLKDICMKAFDRDRYMLGDENFGCVLAEDGNWMEM